ncbi:ATP-binding protein [Streptomyces sp. NPDC047049]|uniref:ATP-binding protein n=1 Tax=Streptomyces sp. NPDC047049 TaxID=3156688 RepID=UPI00340B3CDE
MTAAPPRDATSATVPVPDDVAEAAARPLLARLALLQSRIQRAIVARAATDPQPPADPLRGLYINDELAPHMLRGTPLPLPPDEADALTEAALDANERAAEQAGRTVPLRQLATRFGLSELERDLLLIALAPDLDPRIERCYGYLHDDLTRRRASLGLALTLCGLPAHSATGRAALGPDGALRATGLLEIEPAEDATRPYLTRALRVPDRVTGHLLGRGDPDTATLPHPLALFAQLCSCDGPLGDAAGPPVYLRHHPPRLAHHAAASPPLLALDLTPVTSTPAGPPPCTDLDALLRSAALEARLRGCGLLVGPMDAPAVDGPGRVRHCLAQLAPPQAPRLPLTLTGSRPWDADWTHPGLDAPVELGPDGAPIRSRPVPRPARTAGTGALGRLARRVRPTVGRPDLVLPPRPRALLDDLARRAKHRERVLLDWELRPGGGRGIGVSALFSGPSGTGKTLAAEVVAGELGLDLYVIDLSTVVDKYIGETEKHLEVLFTEAERTDAVLLFDEADAVFGKRSQTVDAHDRYANTSIAYLLQRLESFDGIALLTTNMHTNIDPAFLRRLDVVVPFPAPDVPERRALWDRCLGATAPRATDLQLDLLAEEFDLAGGAIRCCVLTAAYRAAESGRPIGTGDLLAAVRDEYLKLGRYLDESRFPALRSAQPAKEG